LRQGGFQGQGADVVDEIAQLQLGLSEGVLARPRDEQAGDLEDVGGDGLGDVESEFLSLGFLFGGQRFLHGSLKDEGGGFLAGTALSSFVYKYSTNFRDAYTSLTTTAVFP
jgi:hypothetical protein